MLATRGRRVVLGEREFHRWVRAHLPAGHAGRLPIGDDASALSVGRHRTVLLSSDALIENVHFLRTSPPERIGAAATAVNLSDIAAKGGRPAAVLIDLLVPTDTAGAWARSVLRGAERMAARFGCHVLGGDTKPSETRSVVGVSVGWAGPGHIPTRDGARPGDLVVTTGVVGFGGAHRSNITASLDVLPRVAEGEFLGPVAHAMTDTSDGIAEAAHLIAEASHCRVILVAEALPLHPRLGRSGRPTDGQLEAAFYGGDYELFATLPPERLRSTQSTLRRRGGGITVIGRVEPGRGAWLERGGHRGPLPFAGWQPFARR